MLLILAVIGFVVACLLVMDPPDDEPPLAALIRKVELMRGHEVPLGEEFLCTVRLVRYASPNSPRQPHFVSHVRFVCGSPDDSEAFLLDITAGENPSWHLASCRIWTLMSPVETEHHLREHRLAAFTSPGMRSGERTRVLLDYMPPKTESVATLEDPLWRCVPVALQEVGMLVITDDTFLEEIHKLKGFPLRKLAIAIRSADQRDDWTPEDPKALLPSDNLGNRELTVGEQQAVAQSLVSRLLDFLPQEASAPVTRSSGRKHPDIGPSTNTEHK